MVRPLNGDVSSGSSLGEGCSGCDSVLLTVSSFAQALENGAKTADFLSWYYAEPLSSRENS